MGLVGLGLDLLITRPSQRGEHPDLNHDHHGLDQGEGPAGAAGAESVNGGGHEGKPERFVKRDECS
jgi:hypothetical protein